MENKSFTENGAVAHKTTESNLIDLFVKSVRKCDENYITRMCPLCWNENPTSFMALVFLTRDPRNGKGERDVTYSMLKWLKEYCPNTYKKNILKLCETYGRFDDLLKMAVIEPITQIEYNIFADVLKRDIDSDHPSLAAKWASRECNNSEQAKEIAKILFPGDSKCCARYRKEIIAPLAKKLAVVETFMCQNKWDEINYSHVPAQAMKLYGRKKVKIPKNDAYDEMMVGILANEEKLLSNDTCETREGAFLRHDKERFSKYLESVKKGEAKINVSGLEPHKLVEQYMTQCSEEDQTIECQWKTILEKLRHEGNLSSSMALVDVSGSMSGEPMNVAIALGLIVSNLAPEPFGKKFITFESEPHVINITGNSLREQVRCAQSAPWGGSTNFVKAFELILTMATTFNVPKENMIKTLFVFTDMQFDAAFGQQRSHWAYDADSEKIEECTLYQHVRAMYKNSDYDMPQLVFWNLRSSENDAFPVTISNDGTAFVSGFSPELLKVFMSGGQFDPISIFNQFISRYIPEIEVDEDERNIKF